MKKSEKYYYGILNEEDVIDSKRFWKTAKYLFSDKAKSSEKIALVHEDKIITNDDENAKTLISFFSKVIKHLKIPEFKDIDFSTECISHPALKAIIKFSNHPYVSAIRKTRSLFRLEMLNSHLCKHLYPVFLFWN